MSDALSKFLTGYLVAALWSETDDAGNPLDDRFGIADLSADAMGIVASEYAYSNLSFSLSDIAREYARHYHLLREYSMGHPEVREILGATD